ncbi:uncharacterized protein BDZ99DRAFT_33801 [Mytilinidion resinicola]|uniref:Uncharacterized protein n=1 Tax=Mytilinidion resinicola TaxID=574789 RepID=A0A6A6YNS2_9PEZI|nr:uncharacterized protein BDZ99DRAFT_33801 [Mytilinidion resinicola]KAF2809664.1 hypothetical protein BDZ99DRAFT_33801 [Mytilinidion resinicola]
MPFLCRVSRLCEPSRFQSLKQRNIRCTPLPLVTPRGKTKVLLHRWGPLARQMYSQSTQPRLPTSGGAYRDLESLQRKQKGRKQTQASSTTGYSMARELQPSPDHMRYDLLPLVHHDGIEREKELE